METTRRDFIGTAVAGAATTAAMGVAGARPARAQTVGDPADIAWDYECGVAVIGSGAGACLGIIEAFNAGEDVLIVEKMDWLGGTMRRSGGGICAAETCVQKALGVEDDIEEFKNYIITCGGGLADEELLTVFAERANKDFDWFVQDIAGQTEADWKFADDKDGVSFCMRPGLSLSGHGTAFGLWPGFRLIPRCYWFAANPEDTDPDGSRLYCSKLEFQRETDEGRGGTGLYKPVEDFILGNQIPVLYRTSIVSLVKNVAGEVIGVKCKDLETGSDVLIKARKAVLVATGHFAENQWMLDNFSHAGLGMNDPGNVEGQCDGAGILACMGAGAGTARMTYGPIYGGLVTNTKAEVLDVFGDPIPRLYASSYAVGGKMGKSYAHCGLNNMWNMTYGRIAAENIIQLEPWE